MATYTFTGTSQTTPTFNPAADNVVLGVPTSSITNFTQVGSNVVISTTTGSLTLTGVTLASLSSSNFLINGGGSVVIGTTGTDTALDGSPLGDIILGLGGTDTITGGNGDNFILGGSGTTDSVDGADSITAGSGNDKIYGNAGNDTINGGTGNDLIYGGLGVDSITGSTLAGQTASIYGGGGFADTADGGDTINVTNAGTLNVFGNAGVDTITLTQNGGNSTIYGGIGGDAISVAGGSSGNVVIYGGTADVDGITVNGGASLNSTVYGGTGATDATDLGDTISVVGGSSTIYGNGGADTITLTVDGRSVVYGGVGSDTIAATLNSSAASVVIYGGPSETGATETITLTNAFGGAATIFGGTGITDTVDGADSITGSVSADLIYGNAGNDTIVGSGGNDTIFGGLGDDSITASTAGNVSVSGADGADTFVFGSELTSLDTVSGGAGTDTLTFTGSTTSTLALTNVTGIETITLGNAATNLIVTDGLVDAGARLTITGPSGSALNFNGTSETNGSFTITGSSVGDTIIGGAGSDSITGGAGVDSLTGGAGNDTFVFANANSLVDASATDVITDLNLNSADKIDLAVVPTSVFNSGAIGTAANVNDAFTQLSAGQAGLFTIGGSTYLVVDGALADNDGTTVATAAGDNFVINVTGVTGVLDTSDFI